MAPEIQIESQLLESAGIEDSKKIDIWASLKTTFLVMNRDQLYPYEHDVKEIQKQKSSNAFFPSAEHQLKNLTTAKKYHLFRPGMKKNAHYIIRFYIIFSKIA